MVLRVSLSKACHERRQVRWTPAVRELESKTLSSGLRVSARVVSGDSYGPCLVDFYIDSQIVDPSSPSGLIWETDASGTVKPDNCVNWSTTRDMCVHACDLGRGLDQWADALREVAGVVELARARFKP